MAVNNLTDLYQSELRDLYAAEQQIISALPDMARAVTSERLRTALERHLERTRVHVERLELLFKQQGLPTGTPQTSGIESIVRTGSARIRQDGDPDVRDAAIISAAQHIEHYEMAGYGCARTFARQLGDDRAADLLQQTLDEEGAADKELTRLAESGINEAAGSGVAGPQWQMQSRLRYVDVNDLPAASDYRDFKIRNRAGEDLGRIDGFIVDPAGRPYYLVVDSGGVFVGRRYVVPIGKADLVRDQRAIAIDLDKDTMKRYPEFHPDAFMAMDDEEARRYEWRVLEAIDPETARTSTRQWDYDRYPYYRQPDWFEVAVGSTSSRQTRSGSSVRREVPIVTEEEERERMIARERTAGSEDERRERIRGRSNDKTR